MNIPYGKHFITEEDKQAVLKVLSSDFLTQGPCIFEFEDTVKNYCNADYATAVSNATSGLHLAIKAFELNPGDKVLVAGISFVASANCVRFEGGEVIFADIDPKTFTLKVDQVEKALEQFPKKLKGIIAVDLAGHPSKLEEIYSFCKKNNLFKGRFIKDHSFSNRNRTR